MKRRLPRGRLSHRVCAIAVLPVTAAMTAADVTLTQNNSTNWTVTNGQVTAIFNPSSDNVTSVQLTSGGSTSPNMVSQLDQEFAGTPFGSGAQTFSSNVGPHGSYVDVWTTTASAGSAQSSSGAYINPITYAFHYLIFANDPTIYCYETLNHSATDPATSVGQGQFLFRSNPALFPNLYQVNTGVNQLGSANAMNILNVPSTNSNWTASSVQAGRTVQNACTDLTGSGIPGDFGTNFFTKYDYSIYSQFYQAETMWGGNYAVTEVDPTTDSLTGGPTKQELAWTDPGILNMEFLSGHYGTGGTNGTGPFPGYSYYPAQGVATSKLFGPYGFTISSTASATAPQINQNAINSIQADQAEFNTDSELAASGYVNTTARGWLVVNNAANVAGWSSNTANNTAVLSQNGVNFQESTQGSQYWGQISQSGSVAFGNITPGTYRLSVYQLGQWGETRVDGVVIKGNTITLPQNVKFTPENFGTAPPVWTLGTPNRSANEFLNGHSASGADIRAYYGSYDYWAEESALGNPGKVVYYATAVGNTPATNDPNKWIANQWQKFDPGLYDAANGTSDNYSNLAPAYVQAGGGPANYSGAPWEIHFATTAAQDAQGQYVVLSVGLAAAEGSLTVALNGHSETWHVINGSDPMVRSGEAGFYQWLAYQFPTTDLNTPGADNLFTFSTSQTDGDLYDAMRLEITNTSAAPSVTGWSDYEYITGSNSQIDAVDSNSSPASNVYSGTSQWALQTGGSWVPSTSWSNYIIPAAATDVATFGNTIIAPSTVTLDGNRTVGSLVFNSPLSYTIAQGTGGVLTLDAGSGYAIISDLAGSHLISAPVNLASNTVITVANAGDTLTISGPVSGVANLAIAGPGSVVLSGSDTYTGTTTVTAGTLTIARGFSISSTVLNTYAGGTLNINRSISTLAVITCSGTTNFGPHAGTGISALTLAGLNLYGSGLVSLNRPGLLSNRTVLVTSALNFAGSANAWQGILNLADNDMIVRGGNLANVSSQLAAGYSASGSLWNGSSGITSSVAATDSTGLTALGAIQSSGMMFDNVATTASDVLVKFTYFGDANLDGKVDGSDYTRIDSGFLTASTGWYNGDFNYDGAVNGSDYTLIDNAFNGQGATLASSIASPNVLIADQIAGTVQVPEPTIIAFALLPIALLSRRPRNLPIA